MEIPKGRARQLMLGKNRCIGDLSANPDLSELTEDLAALERLFRQLD
jgi:hypothetical protein